MNNQPLIWNLIFCTKHITMRTKKSEKSFLKTMKKQIPEKHSILQRAVPNIIEETIAQNPIWKINMKQILHGDERDKRTRKPLNRSKRTRTRGLCTSLRYSKQWEGVIKEEMVPSLRIWEKKWRRKPNRRESGVGWELRARKNPQIQSLEIEDK